MDPVDIEAVRGQPAPPDPKKWVCCLDCGLLIEPMSKTGKQWTICSACVRVYTLVDHPWLSKMLAKRVANAKNNASKIQKTYKHVFLCRRCNKYYLRMAKDSSGDICRWCQTLHTKSAKAKVPCVVCKTTDDQNRTESSVMCNECVKHLQSVRKALEYTYYIAWQARYLRGHDMLFGAPQKIGKKLKLREDFK